MWGGCGGGVYMCYVCRGVYMYLVGFHWCVCVIRVLCVVVVSVFIYVWCICADCLQVWGRMSVCVVGFCEGN